MPKLFPLLFHQMPNSIRENRSVQKPILGEPPSKLVHEELGRRRRTIPCTTRPVDEVHVPRWL